MTTTENASEILRICVDICDMVDGVYKLPFIHKKISFWYVDGSPETETGPVIHIYHRRRIYTVLLAALLTHADSSCL